MHMHAKALLLATAVATLSLCGCKSHHTAEKSAPAAKIDPAPIQAVAKSPAPPADAKKATTLGSGATTINTDNGSDDTDLTWVQEIDITGDGEVDSVTLLWDDEAKMLFAYAESDVLCAYGGVAVAKVLIGVNAKGNPRNQPEGAGFFAVFLDAMECGAEGAGLYGARFDQDGYITEAGAVVIDEEALQVRIVEPGYYVY